jgi:hypothetical protein
LLQDLDRFVEQACPSTCLAKAESLCPPRGAAVELKRDHERSAEIATPFQHDTPCGAGERHMISAHALGLRSVVALALAMGGVSLGCGSDKPPVTAADTLNEGADSQEDAAKRHKSPNQGNIVIDPKIAALCNLSTANFAFDSAALSVDAEQALSALAKCFVDGALKGEGMRLAGHADPRKVESLLHD